MTPRSLGYYVYCIVPADDVPGLAGLTGVDPSFDVGALTDGPLCAIVSRVSMDQFGAEALRHNLEDVGWLSRTARAHHAVLTRALGAEAVVPLRLCTIFADEAGVHGALAGEHGAILEALTRLRGHAEWSVKGLVDPRVLTAAAREHGAALEETMAEGPGHAYFARRRLERAARDQGRATVERAAEQAHARLDAEAVAATRLPPQDRQLSGRTGEMILNGAYLVARSRAPAFAALAEELDARHRGAGLVLELGGPFAPYNFVAAGADPS
jgi:hypothetical protein